MTNVTTRRAVVRWRLLTLPLLLLLLLGAGSLRSQTLMSQYIFTAGSGSQLSMPAPSTAYGSGSDDGVNGPWNIGFNFVLAGTTYTQFSTTPNGYIGLGSTLAGTSLSGTFGSTSMGVPIIAGFWRDNYTADGNVTYQTIGNAPNRILVVQWRVNACCASGAPGSTFQVRLYEGSNSIEIWYGAMNISCGQIGVQVTTSNFASVTPPSTVNYASGNGCSSAPAVNAMYTFTPCVITPTGVVPQGGTAAMADQDSLMLNISVQRGASGTFQPFVVTGPGCGATAITFAISGVNAGDYQIAPTSSTVSSSQSVTPTITFTPQGVGKRKAILTVTAGAFTRTYNLAATGAPRISWTGYPAQGGTVALKSGDTLLRSVSIPRGTSIVVSPLMLTNFSTNGSIPAAAVTYTIKGTSGGQYVITPGSASLGAGQSSTPVITFNATGIGLVVDTLTVVADGETRVFVLHGFSQAPGGEFRVDGQLLTTSTGLYRNNYGCVGEALTYEIKVTNPAYGILRINSVDVFTLDTLNPQANKFALLLDGQGHPIPNTDYIITDTPPTMPLTNTTTWPILIPADQPRSIYLTFLARGSAKRYARIFLHTNAENFSNPDYNGTPVEGLLSFDLFARGIAGHLSAKSGGRLENVVFNSIRLNETAEAKVPLVNTGECQLRISLNSIVPSSGDVNDFSVAKFPSKMVDARTNDLLIPPGGSDTIVFRFKPVQMGSRRATVTLTTNDSTMEIPGITNRGVYYIDLFGTGQADLYTEDVDFGTALIGGSGSDQIQKTVHLQNTRNVKISISKVLIEGADAADFVADAGNPQPPFTIEGGQQTTFNVTFAPASGAPGARTATMKMITANGDTVISHLTGIAGTRTIVVTPTAINFGRVRIGKVYRQTITITNTGTMPVTLVQPMINPGSDFSLSMFPRLTLAPGQTEYLEISYAPRPGPSDIGLTLLSNATTGPVLITLQGDASRTMPVGDLGERASDANYGDEGFVSSDAVSGVADEATITGLKLAQSMPNPGRDQVEIRYTLATAGEARLELYDATGRLLKVLAAGQQLAGEQRVIVDVRDLASGTYHYRLSSNGKAVSKVMTIAH